MVRGTYVAGSSLVLVATLVAAQDAAAAAAFDEACLAEDDSSESLSFLQRRRAKAEQSVQRDDRRRSHHTHHHDSHHHDSDRRRHSYDETPLVCEGHNFFDCFHFMSGPDPTWGFVKYVEGWEAKKDNLTQTNYENKGQIYIGSSTGHHTEASTVRLETNRRFNRGLFLLDVAHVPDGPGTWPAWWLVGPKWPATGEFDMYEAVNNDTEAKTSFHTTQGCLMSSVQDIDNGGDGNSLDGGPGAGVRGNKAGKALNDVGGGIIAALWQAEGFSIWFFTRDKLIPKDLIEGGKPRPSEWGKPWRFFPLGRKCMTNHFKEMNVVLNLDYCGMWAGEVFPGGNDACIDHIRKHKTPEGYWLINSMRVYPLKGLSVPHYHTGK